MGGGVEGPIITVINACQKALYKYLMNFGKLRFTPRQGVLPQTLQHFGAIL